MRKLTLIMIIMLVAGCGARNVDLNKTYSKQDAEEVSVKSDSTQVVKETKHTNINMESLDSFGLEISPTPPTAHNNHTPDEPKRKLTVTDSKGNTLTTTLNALDNVLFGSQSQNKLKLNIAQTKIDSLSVSNKSLMSKIKSLEKKKEKVAETKIPMFWAYILVAVISFFGGFYLSRKI